VSKKKAIIVGAGAVTLLAVATKAIINNGGVVGVVNSRRRDHEGWRS
jgi:hypothetical protein